MLIIDIVLVGELRSPQHSYRYACRERHLTHYVVNDGSSLRNVEANMTMKTHASAEAISSSNPAVRALSHLDFGAP